MFESEIKYPTIILFVNGFVDDVSNEIKKLHPNFNIIIASTENFYNLLIKEKQSLAISTDSLLIDFANQISDPEKLSEIYLKNIILFCENIPQFESLIYKFPFTSFYPVPLLSDFVQTLKIFKTIFSAVISNFEKEEFLEQISLLQSELSEVKFNRF